MQKEQGKKMKSYKDCGLLQLTAKNFSRNESLREVGSLRLKRKNETCIPLQTGFNYKFPT